MDIYRRELNTLSDPNRMKRAKAIQNILSTLQDPTKDPFLLPVIKPTNVNNININNSEDISYDSILQKGFSTDSERRQGMHDVLSSAIKLFEDEGERTREYSIAVVMELVPRMSGDTTVIDWVLPPIVARIGIEPVAEPSEEIRLLFLKLSMVILECYPNDVGPKNYHDFYRVLFENCLKDPSPDVRRAACEACVVWCRTDPKAVTKMTLPLAKVVKNMCLSHKHRSTRIKAVSALSVLIAHGAQESLADERDEADNNTTVHAILVAANDDCDSVRLAVVKELLTSCLLEIQSCRDQHRRLLPHLLLMLTDRCQEVQEEANALLLKLGRQFSVDHEDNTINVEQRRINLKDLEWYGDDVYPDMSISIPYAEEVHFPGNLKARPILGARSAVADVARVIIEKVLTEINVMDWTIAHSNMNRRIAALRILSMIIFYCETNIVQFTQIILYALYKGLRDDNEEVRNWSLICVEILGKFLQPSQFLPFILAQPPKEKEELRLLAEEETRQEKGKAKIITITSASAPNDMDARAVVPTLLSTTADVTKSCILVSFKHLLKGSRNTITPQEAAQVVKGLTSSKLLEMEAPNLLLSLSETILEMFDILSHRGMIITPGATVEGTGERCIDVFKRNIKERTLDSVLFYVLLTILGSSDAALVRHVETVVIPKASMLTTGTETGLYDVHFGRLIYAHLLHMPVSVFSSLILNAVDIQPYTEQICQIFLQHLSNVDFKLRVSDQLLFFKTLDQLLWQGKVIFSPTELGSILRSIIINHGTFKPSAPAHLFRKLAITCLRSIFTDAHLPTLDAVFSYDNTTNNRDKYTNEVKTDTPCPLAGDVVSVWHAAMGTDDDAEMRQACVLMFPAVATLRLSEGAVTEGLTELLMRLDDPNDIIRVATLNVLLLVFEKVYEGNYYKDHVSTAISLQQDRDGDVDDCTVGNGSTAALLRDRPIDAILYKELTGTKMNDIAKTVCLHMDDGMEVSGVKDSACAVLQVMNRIQRRRLGEVGSEDSTEKPKTPIDSLMESAKTPPNAHARAHFYLLDKVLAV